MKPVKQSKLYTNDGIHNGNCYAACLASLLEIPLWLVPPFDAMFGRGGWRPRVDEWLSRMFGLELILHDDEDGDDFLPEFYMVSGESNRGVMHSVIFSKGKLIHDPHYSNEGIKEIQNCWYLQKLTQPHTKEI